MPPKLPRKAAPNQSQPWTLPKHVVCEKPLALTSADTTDLVERARAAGKVNAVCFNIRFYPLCHQMRAMVAAGAVPLSHATDGGGEQ